MNNIIIRDAVINDINYIIILAINSYILTFGNFYSVNDTEFYINTNFTKNNLNNWISNKKYNVKVIELSNWI